MPGPRLRAPPLLLPRLLGDDPRHDPTPHRRAPPPGARRRGWQRELPAPARRPGTPGRRRPGPGRRPPRTQIDDLQTRLREAETHSEHLAITRTTVSGLADRSPAGPPDLPEYPDHPRILPAFNQTTGPLRAKDVCELLGHELLPKNAEGARAKLQRLVGLGILTEADTGNLRKQ
ncbi:hypothetical protein NGM37_50755 [Streptomyces sp. TRM76130]|nr:hypothetical protein [Streptomyces sp. TRM76130]